MNNMLHGNGIHISSNSSNFNGSLVKLEVQKTSEYMAKKE